MDVSPQPRSSTRCAWPRWGSKQLPVMRYRDRRHLVILIRELPSSPTSRKKAFPVRTPLSASRTAGVNLQIMGTAAVSDNLRTAAFLGALMAENVKTLNAPFSLGQLRNILVTPTVGPFIALIVA